MNKLCLVTGGAGFIGSHLVEGLTATGYRVRVLDNLLTGLRSNLASVTPAPEIIEGDVGNPADVDRAMQGVDLIFHLAALASVQQSVDNPAATHQTCATGSLNILDAARRHKVQRVVYAGSSSAYGIPVADVQTEADPLTPLSPYAAAKLAGELYMQAFATTYGLETVRLRFFNIFGPRQRADSPYSGVIALFASALTNGRAPTIFGDGQQSRDFTYVTDVVQALLKAATAANVAGQVYNVGTGKSVSLLELLVAMNRVMGTNAQAVLAPARAGDVRHSRADITRTRQALGYEPRVSFEDGLAETLKWMQSS